MRKLDCRSEGIFALVQDPAMGQIEGSKHLKLIDVGHCAP
jgi:hypothetical protein